MDEHNAIQHTSLQDTSVLAYQSLNALRVAFRQGELSPVDVLREQQEQMRLWSPHVNALTARFDHDARMQAEQSALRYAKRTERALEGITVAIKDESFVEGQMTTNGSVLLQKHYANVTDPVPERLLNSGALIHARTTTPEFSTAGYTWSKLWGVSRNPWNPAITCGGSSGGSAIALATGMTTLANGSDAGGSIRIPAALCGLYGYKAPHGRIPEASPYGLEPYCHHGVMTRNLDDLLAVYPLIKGCESSDLHSYLPDNNPLLIPEKSLSTLRVAVSVDLGFYSVERDIVSALDDTVSVLKKAGVDVHYVNLPWDERVIQTAKTHQFAMLGQLLLRKYGQKNERDQLTSYVQHYLDGAARLSVSDIVDANLYAAEMWGALSKVFQTYDVLICPTMASNNIPAEFDYSRDQCLIEGKTVDSNKGWFMTYAFNTLNACPVLAMPNGFSRNGVPTSMQIVGRPYQESLIFELARYLEKNIASDFYSSRFPVLPGKVKST